MASLTGLVFYKSILYRIQEIILFVTPAYILQWTKNPAIDSHDSLWGIACWGVKLTRVVTVESALV
jgi:hypothetical protein